MSLEKKETNVTLHFQKSLVSQNSVFGKLWSSRWKHLRGFFWKKSHQRWMRKLLFDISFFVFAFLQWGGEKAQIIFYAQDIIRIEKITTFCSFTGTGILLRLSNRTQSQVFGGLLHEFTHVDSLAPVNKAEVMSLCLADSTNKYYPLFPSLISLKQERT